MYVGWSGNVSTFLLGGMNTSFGLKAQPFSCVFLLVVWWLATFGALRKALHGRCVVSDNALSAALTSTLLLAVLAASPNIYQSVYWQAGRLVYLLPIQLSSITLWLVLQERIRGTTQALLVGLVQAAASMTSVSYVLVAVVGLPCIGIALRKGRRAGVLSAATLGALVGLLVLVAAPGNAIRRSFFPPPDFERALVCALSAAPTCIVRPWLRAPLPLLAAVVLSGMAGFRFDRGPSPSGRWLLAGPVAALGASFLAYAPACYAASVPLPDRAVFVPSALTIACLAVFAYGLGRRFSRVGEAGGGRLSIVSTTLLVALLAGAASHGIVQALDTRERMAALAAAWDVRDRRIREKIAVGRRHIVAPSLAAFFDLPDLSDDPRDGVNLCIAGYYSIGSIVASHDRARHPGP
jgi:hypothetical protein